MFKPNKKMYDRVFKCLGLNQIFWSIIVMPEIVDQNEMFSTICFVPTWSMSKQKKTKYFLFLGTPQIK